MKKLLLPFLTLLALGAKAQVDDVPVSANPSTIQSGQTSMISTTGSQLGVDYTLRNSSNAVVAGPSPGSGGNISFIVSPQVTETYNILASVKNSVGVKLDGWDDYFAADLDSAFDYSSGFTFEAWIKTPKPTQTTSFHPILFIGSTGVSDVEIYVRSTDMALVYDRNKPSQKVITYGSPPNNSWFHFAVTFNGVTTLVYYDGVVQNATSGTGSGAMTRSPNTEINVGTISYGGFPVSPSYNKYTEGTIDDVRIWNSARSANDILSSSATCISGTTVGLEALYRLNEASGTDAIDEVGNNDGSLINIDTSIAWTIVEHGSIPCIVSLDTQLTQTATVTVSGVGIEEESLQSNITLYPNPAGQQIAIGTTEPVDRIHIFDLMGKPVKSSYGNDKVLDISELSVGFYIVRVHTASGISQSRFLKE